MGVYIDMEMPKEGEYRMTLYVLSDGSAYIDVASFPVGEDKFEAVHVPPHGDLIDRHQAYLRFGELAEKIEEKSGYEDGAPYALSALFLNNTDEFPTIIPATERETDS